MADLVVHPSVVVGPEDIITADLLNLLATPIVDLALADPVNDQSFLRNGNFYSSFWTTPAGKNCPVNVETSNANYWYTKPQGAAVTTKRSTSVPDTNSLFSHEVDGAAGVTTVEFGQNINADLSATLRRTCTFSGNIFNGTGLVVSPKLEVYTADAFNNFATKTLRTTIDLQTCANNVWTFVSATLDLGPIVNVTNGVSIVILYPSGTLLAGKSVNHSRLKFQIGEVATEFVDDTSLFVTSPSVDSTMLQDGCIARSTLFLPNVIPTGTYQAKSINNGDINDSAIDARTISGASTTLTAAYFQPAVSATVSIAVVSTSKFGAGQSIWINGGGPYTVSSVTDITHLVVTNTGGTGSVTPGTTVPSGGSVTFPSAVIGALGYTPINKAGDIGIGPGVLAFVNDDPVGSTSHNTSALRIEVSSANASNDGYFGGLSFQRGSTARTIGLSTTSKFKTVDNSGVVGYLLDSVNKVDTASYQDASITYPKLASSLITTVCPIGMVVQYAGPNIPTGWFPCDGSWLLRTDYPALFSAIGTYWGVADGSLYFPLPNLQGRVPVGYIGNGTTNPGYTFRGFGTNGGEETHVLSIGELASHNHTISDPGHNHTLHDPTHSHGYVNPVGGSASQPGSGQASAFGSAQTTAVGTGIFIDSAVTNIAIVNNGGNVAHNNMMPYAVLFYIIKGI